MWLVAGSEGERICYRYRNFVARAATFPATRNTRCQHNYTCLEEKGAQMCLKSTSYRKTICKCFHIVYRCNYGLDGRSSIPGRGNIFFSPPQRSYLLWRPPRLLSDGYRELFSRGKSNRSLTLTTHFHLEPRWRMVGLHLHYLIFIHGMVLNYSSTGTELIFTSTVTIYFSVFK
jgi:hypothetical protein